MAVDEAGMYIRESAVRHRINGWPPDDVPSWCQALVIRCLDSIQSGHLPHGGGLYEQEARFAWALRVISGAMSEIDFARFKAAHPDP